MTAIRQDSAWLSQIQSKWSAFGKSHSGSHREDSPALLTGGLECWGVGCWKADAEQQRTDRRSSCCAEGVRACRACRPPGACWEGWRAEKLLPLCIRRIC